MNNKGQTLTEFMLVFVVLLIATTGVFALYKSFWKTRYDKTAAKSGVAAAAVNVVSDNKYTSYVK
ncbi:hypothetical protein [Endomicrobium proavitum]|uniref:Type II secretion protein n=1 Tax=Endomicrobium proavitum TaxID=1408281 RepID=A0A0G3WH52_9BACT|nr:hypothetical protein [Endomicrobium proavitum]AKL97663.1 type II secretion protein [Endomicrobium proavitum]